MKIKEIRDKNEDGLRHDLADRQKHLFDLRSQAVTEKLEDPTQIGKTRRDIARIKTILRQRELEAKQAAEPPAVKTAGTPAKATKTKKTDKTAKATKTAKA